MNLFDCINFSLIGGCSFFCVIMGFKKKTFKKLAYIYSTILAFFAVVKCNVFLLPEIKVTYVSNTLLGEYTEKIYSAIYTLLGTIIMTIALHILIKNIFRVVDRKFDRDIYAEVMDRIRGAVDGLFELCTVGIFSTYRINGVIETSAPKIIHTNFSIPSNADMYRLGRNLN